MMRLGTVILATALAAGCAGGFDPKPVDAVPFRDRAVTQAERGISVTAAVPSADETRELFGTSLYRRRVQPVWLEVVNSTDEWIALLPAGTDLDYHSPFEVAALHSDADAREQAEQYFFNQGFQLQIAPGESRTGFIFTNLDEGTKAFNVDLVADEDAWQFTFFIQVPGLAIDHHDVDFDALYAEDEISHFTDAAAFIEALEQLPCCTTDADGENQGDPLNLVLIG